MLGRFLEVSLSSANVLESIEKFTRLGFREIPVGDVWSHPYAVVSDGALNVGLHRYEFDSPSLTFVQHDLEKWIEAYRVQGIDLAFEKLTSESFNELGFVDPGGQMTAVLESRTFSPPPFDERDTSIFSRFKELELPTNDVQESRAFWRKIGLEDDGTLGGAGVTIRFGGATSLVCHFDADILTLAAEAARRGVNATIAGDERSARATIDGLTLVAHQR